MVSSPIDEVKSRLDVVEVIRGYMKVQKVGANYRSLCPFHGEKKPSFYISPTRQRWHCFGCALSGSIFDFVMRVEGIEFGDALRILAHRAGVELQREDPRLRTERARLYEICELACRFFERQLEGSETGKTAKSYLLERGIAEESIRKWHIGYAPDTWRGLSDFLVSKGYQREEIAKAGLVLKAEKAGNYYDRFRGRIMFPIHNIVAQPIGFGGRIFETAQRANKDEVAKYMNTPATLLYDKSRVLYGLHLAGIAIRKGDCCMLVEGYIDAIMVSQAGFENVVASSGTALTPQQLTILKRYSDNLFTAFDRDIAGGSATKRGIDLAQSLGFAIKIITMPEGTDPADIIQRDGEEWNQLVQDAKSIHDFYFETTLAQYDKTSLEGKKEISKTLLPVIKNIPNKIEQSVWVQDLARTLGVQEEHVAAELHKTLVGQQETEVSLGGSKIASVSQKSRKELLEERLLILALKHPQNLQNFTPEDRALLSPMTSKTIGYLENGSKTHAQEISADLTDFINYLSLKAENEEEAESDYGEEFCSCIKEMKTLAMKDKLDSIAKAIKKSEEEKDAQKTQELMQEFNKHSKTFSDLETA